MPGITKTRTDHSDHVSGRTLISKATCITLSRTIEHSNCNRRELLASITRQHDRWVEVTHHAVQWGHMCLAKRFRQRMIVYRLQSASDWIT